MKSKSMIGIFLLLLYVACGITGCATVKIWSSSPVIRTISTDTFDAGLKPLVKEGQSFYNRFQFSFKNKTDMDLVIDWQNSRYLQNGRENGRFVFREISTDNLDNLPSDTVSPGAELSREIMPLQLIGYERISSLGKQPGGDTFGAGIIPEGEHGILLVVNQGGKRIPVKIQVRITVKET